MNNMWGLYLGYLILLLNNVDGIFVDLSWTMNQDHMSIARNVTSFTSEVVLAGPFGSAPWAAENDIGLSEHVGTHLDAPYHFDQYGKYVDELTYDELHGPAVVIDVRERVEYDSDTVITINDLTDWEEKYGAIPDKAWILMHSGWYQNWGDDPKYFGTNETTVCDWHFPGFSEEAVNWLLQNRPGFNGLASDSLSCDNGPLTCNKAYTMPVHQLLLTAGKLCLENMNGNVANLPASGAEVFNFPMKLYHGTGAPTRFYAIHGVNKFSSAPQQKGTTAILLGVMLSAKLIIDRYL